MLDLAHSVFNAVTGVTMAVEIDPKGGWVGGERSVTQTLYGPVRARLYRSRFLRPQSHFAAFFEFYKINKLLTRSLENSIFCTLSELGRIISQNFGDFCRLLEHLLTFHQNLM